jgi:hypothetical protein
MADEPIDAQNRYAFVARHDTYHFYSEVSVPPAMSRRRRMVLRTVAAVAVLRETK